jgi:chromosome segregation ATPase
MPEEKKEEYEIIPISPLRRLEKRIEQLEAMSPAVDVKEIFREVVDVLRMNQQLVTEISKSNDALRLEISKLTINLEDLTARLNELLSYIKAAATEEGFQPEDTTKGLKEKMNELIEANKKIAQSNEEMISILEEIEKKLSRPLMPMPLRKPMPPKM